MAERFTPQWNHNPEELDAFIALFLISGGRRPAFGRAALSLKQLKLAQGGAIDFLDNPNDLPSACNNTSLESLIDRLSTEARPSPIRSLILLQSD